jgi:hypothetical protein
MNQEAERVAGPLPLSTLTPRLFFFFFFLLSCFRFLDILGLLCNFLPRSRQQYEANYIANELFHHCLSVSEFRNNGSEPRIRSRRRRTRPGWWVCREEEGKGIGKQEGEEGYWERKKKWWTRIRIHSQFWRHVFPMWGGWLWTNEVTRNTETYRRPSFVFWRLLSRLESL